MPNAVYHTYIHTVRFDMNFKNYGHINQFITFGSSISVIFYVGEITSTV